MAIKVVLVERRDEWGGGRLTSPKDLLTARPVGGLGQTSFLIPGCLITAQSFPHSTWNVMLPSVTQPVNETTETRDRKEHFLTLVRHFNNKCVWYFEAYCKAIDADVYNR